MSEPTRRRIPCGRGCFGECQNSFSIDQTATSCSEESRLSSTFKPAERLAAVGGSGVLHALGPPSYSPCLSVDRLFRAYRTRCRL